MKKLFVAMMMALVLMISIEATAENLNYTYFGGDGIDAWLSDIYMNEDGSYGQKILLGDHWEFQLKTDNLDGYTAEWYAYCDGKLVWFDKDYDESQEQSIQGLDNVVGIIVEKYYDGMGA